MRPKPHQPHRVRRACHFQWHRTRDHAIAIERCVLDKLYTGRQSVYGANGYFDRLGFPQPVSESKSVQLPQSSDDDQLSDNGGRRHDTARPVLADLQHDDSGDAVPEYARDLQESELESTVGQRSGSSMDERSVSPPIDPRCDYCRHPTKLCVQEHRVHTDAGRKQ